MSRSLMAGIKNDISPFSKNKSKFRVKNDLPMASSSKNTVQKADSKIPRAPLETIVSDLDSSANYELQNYFNSDDTISNYTTHSFSSVLSSPISAAAENDNHESHADIPDGGVQAWLVILGSFLGLTNSFGIVNTMSAIETYISSHQLKGISQSSVGWVFSIYTFISLFFCIFMGNFFDKRGPRLPILLGTVLTFVGIFITGNCEEIYQFILAFGIIAGIGNAVQIPALVGIIPHYFSKRRGFATGLATMGGSVGGALFPIMLRSLYSRIGFVWSMRVFAFLLAALDIAAMALIKPRAKMMQNTPENKNNSNEFSFLQNVFKYLHWKTIYKFVVNSVDFRALKEPRFLTCALAVMFSEVFLVTSLTYFGSYAVFKGTNESTAYLLITLINACGVGSRLLAGFLSDKFGNFNVMTVMMTASVLFNFAIWLPFGHSIKGLYAYSVLFGVSSASTLSLSPLCLGQVSRVEDFGRRYATAYVLVATGCLIGIPVSGLFIGASPSSRSYDNFIIFVSIIGVLAVVFWLSARYIAVKFRMVKF